VPRSLNRKLVLGLCTFRYLAPQVSMVAIVTKSMVSSSLCRRASIVVHDTNSRSMKPIYPIVYATKM
jgi:hypothetical protein